MPPDEAMPAVKSSPVEELMRARWAVRLTTCLMAAVGIGCLLLFAYQVQRRDEHETLLGWILMSGALLRGCIGLFLCFNLLWYLRELRKLNSTIDVAADFGPLISVTARCWRALGWSGVAILLFIVMSSLYVEYIGHVSASTFGAK